MQMFSHFIPHFPSFAALTIFGESQDRDRIIKLKWRRGGSQRPNGKGFCLGLGNKSAQVNLKQSCIQFILISESIQMQSPLLPQRKIRFNSGKTFFLPPSAQPAGNAPLSLLQSQARTQFHHILPNKSNQDQHILWNSHPFEQRLPPMFVTPAMLLSSPQQSLNNSQRQRQTLRNLKDSNRSSCSNFAQLTSDARLAKKNKIFQVKNTERGEIMGKGVGNNFNSGFSPEYNKNRRVIFAQQKESSINFARKQCENSQQIASYFRLKRPNAIKTQLLTPFRQYHKEAQQSQSTRCYKRMTSTSLESFNRLPQSNTNIDLEGRARKEGDYCLEYEHQQSNQNYRYESTFRNTKHIVKEVKIKKKSDKEHPLKGSLNIFCEQSTIKAKRQAEENPISVSNIEQDNSFSRYYDSKDDLLPLLNKISYKNVEIQKKSQASQDQMATPNIFMDFDKVTSPKMNRKQHRQIIHFDCTQQSQILCNEYTIQAKPRSRLSTLAPICLVLITITLLVIQAFF